MSDSSKPASVADKTSSPSIKEPKSAGKKPPRNASTKASTTSPSKPGKEKENKETTKDTATNPPTKKSKPRPKSTASTPPAKKSPSPSPSKSPRGPKAGASRDHLRLPRLRSTNSLGPAPSHPRTRSAASSPSASAKRPPGSVTPRFPSANIPIPVPDLPKAERRRRNAESESSTLLNGLSHNQGVFSPGLANTSRRRPEFVIHPEWMSEAVGVDKLPPLPHPFRTKQALSESCPAAVGSLWPKRCKSAPPPNYRNPITWEE